MDDAELVKRLLVNAQTMEVMSEGAESPFSRAAKNQRDAASRIESLSAVIAANMELLQEIDSHWRRGEYGKAADHHRDQVTAALSERGANDK